MRFVKGVSPGISSHLIFTFFLSKTINHSVNLHKPHSYIYVGTKSAVGVTLAKHGRLIFMAFAGEINLLEITNDVNAIPGYIYQATVQL